MYKIHWTLQLAILGLSAIYSAMGFNNNWAVVQWVVGFAVLLAWCLLLAVAWTPSPFQELPVEDEK